MSDTLQIFGTTYNNVTGIIASDGSNNELTYIRPENGSATTPATTITANPTITVSSSGLITATVNKVQSVTPTVVTGYISSGTAGNITVSGSETNQLTTRNATTITPGTTNQTIAANTYLTGAQTISGDSNLIASNIKKDVTIFGVTGTFDNSPNIYQDNEGYVVLDKEGSGSGNNNNNNNNGHFADDPKLVFIDYDGTVLSSYTGAEAQAMTALPANPSHSGLVAQGWNWTLQQIKAQLTAYPNQAVYVGQMYITQSGDTEIDVSFVDSTRLSPIMTIAVNGTITIDWGDNTTPDTITGTSLTARKSQQHTYASIGNYTIIIHVVDGTFQFYTGSNYQILRKSTSVNANRVYTNTLRAVRFGKGISQLYSYIFSYCTSLASITIPNSITSIGSNAFSSCYSISSITIPSSVTSISSSAFAVCYSLTSITIPSNITSIGSSAFSSCYSIVSITIPSNVISIGDSAFINCCSIKSITIPSDVTSINSSAFSNCTSLASITIPSNITSIGNSAFSSCFSLASITIPSDVTSIGSNAFTSCYGVAEYHILPVTIPTGGTTMFSSIVSDCVIYVPKGKLSDYQGATNWSTYASYMQEEP